MVGPEREAHLVAVERPALRDVAARGDGLLVRRVLHLRGEFAHRRGNRVEQAGNRLVEALVGHHGRDRRAHADVGVGPGDRVDAVDRRQRKLREHVVRGGAALAHHLRGADHGGQVLVLQRAPAGRPGHRVEIELQRVAVEQALGEARLRVVVAVDQAGDQRAVGGVDALGVGVLDRAGRDDVADRVAVDHDVGGGAFEGIGAQHAAAMDELHGSSPLCCPDESYRRDQRREADDRGRASCRRRNDA